MTPKQFKIKREENKKALEETENMPSITCPESVKALIGKTFQSTSNANGPKLKIVSQYGRAYKIEMPDGSIVLHPCMQIASAHRKDQIKAV